MIVVDGGDKLIGKDVECEVTRIFQTVAGKMIFAAPKNTKKSISSTAKPRMYKQNKSSKAPRKNYSKK
jgi:hypothetical protein